MIEIGPLRRRRAPGSRCTRSTARCASPRPRCWRGSTSCSSTSRTWGCASTPSCGPWRWPWRRAPRRGCASWSWTAPTRWGASGVEGPVLRAGFESFVGLHPIPLRHGLTMGELARWLNAERGIGCDLEVVPMEGWRREMPWADTGLPWVIPSPNLPTPDSCAVYPGMVLVEGTNLSEGRGTTRPFELVGAPVLDPASRWPSGWRRRPSRACASGRAPSSPRSRSTPARCAAACSSTSRTRRAFRPVRTAVELFVAARAAGARRLRVAPSALRVRGAPHAHRHPVGARGAARRAWTRGVRPTRSWRAWRPSARRSWTRRGRISCTTEGSRGTAQREGSPSPIHR